jgi:hypothetical protein
MTANQPICPNCDTLPAGDYCQACGQRQGHHRFTLISILHEIPHAIFHVDRGLPATLRELARHPGVAIRGYLDGQRTRYYNPLTLLVLMAGLSAFLFSAYPFDFSFAMAAYATEMGPLAKKYGEFGRQVFRFYSLTLVLYLPVTALISWACFTGRGTERARTYGEHLIINAYVMAFMSFLMVLVFPVLAVTNGTVTFSVLWSVFTLVLLAYQIVAYYAVFAYAGHRATAAIRSIAATGLYLALVTAAPLAFFFLVYLKL